MPPGAQPIMPATIHQSMYLVLPVPFREQHGAIQVEAQAANGLDRWADNFARVTVAATLLPEAEGANLPGFVWRDLSSLQHADRIVCQPLPVVHSTRDFFRKMASVRKHMADTIRSSEHLQFAISGLSGDWAAIAALEAIEQKRRFAIHTDCVEFELIKKTSAGASLKQRLKIAVIAPLMKLYHRHIIRHASLGLWHGNDCYRAFSPWCSESHLVHDIHTKQSDLIGDGELATKLAEVESASVLRLIYAGRLHPMKAPLEWLGAVAVARDKGARFTATWFGEGPLLEQAKAERERLHLEGIVTFAGFVADRATLLHHVRSAHAVLFTHVTPESPRNLLEALVSGTPILGYDNPYAVDLIREQGGGALVPLHDMQALGELIAELASDRARMAHLIADAASNGRRFSDSAVFAERSALLQRFA